MRAPLLVLLLGNLAAAKDSWVTYDGHDGPCKGKYVVLVSGDEEYRSEEALPQLAKILSVRHGCKCTVLFAIDPADGAINPDIQNNIPGLEALKSADLMVIATRFRNLPDEQMKHIVAYVESGKPIIGMRTGTHAFKLPKEGTYSKYSFDSVQKGWEGGFGRRILGETWINHHGQHGKQSTRGVLVSEMKDHPILKGCDDIWGPTDVYVVRLPLPGDSKPLVLGQVLDAMQPDSKAVAGKQNDPMMPIAWSKTYEGEGTRDEGRGTGVRRRDGMGSGRVFTTTMGSSTDLNSPGVRRLLVNAVYWCLGLENKINGHANVDIVGTYKPTPFGFGKYTKGLKPADFEMQPRNGDR